MKPLTLALIAKKPGHFTTLGSALSRRDELDVRYYTSGAQALEMVADGTIDVVVAAEEIEEGSGLAFIRELVRQHPFVNCALESPLYPQEFHEQTEGLGVFMQLPSNPGEEAAQRMMGLLPRLG